MCTIINTKKIITMYAQITSTLRIWLLSQKLYHKGSYITKSLAITHKSETFLAYACGMFPFRVHHYCSLNVCLTSLCGRFCSLKFARMFSLSWARKQLLHTWWGHSNPWRAVTVFVSLLLTRQYRDQALSGGLVYLFVKPTHQYPISGGIFSRRLICQHTCRCVHLCCVPYVVKPFDSFTI